MNTPQLATPIAFVIFNRPDTTEKVFGAIRKARPRQLFIIADGPRPSVPDDVENCQSARAIVDRVDWNCEVITEYSDRNLGCRKRVSSGLNWVFNFVEEALILEDDCLPDPTFFQFTEELLDKYRNDDRIMVISGNNFQFGKKYTDYSYYFSRYNHCWGWATWKRAWKYYDDQMKRWQEIRDNEWLESILEDPRAVKYWTQIFQDTYLGKYDSWAYRWTLSCWLQNGLTVLPDRNLVSNIGFGSRSTHTTHKRSPLDSLPTRPMNFPLQHPPYTIRNVEADRRSQRLVYQGGKKVALEHYLTGRLKLWK